MGRLRLPVCSTGFGLTMRHHSCPESLVVIAERFPDGCLGVFTSTLTAPDDGHGEIQFLAGGPEAPDTARQLAAMALAAAAVSGWSAVGSILDFALMGAAFGNRECAAAAVFIDELLRQAWPTP